MELGELLEVYGDLIVVLALLIMVVSAGLLMIFKWHWFFKTVPATNPQATPARTRMAMRTNGPNSAGHSVPPMPRPRCRMIVENDTPALGDALLAGAVLADAVADTDDDGDEPVTNELLGIVEPAPMPDDFSDVSPPDRDMADDATDRGTSNDCHSDCDCSHDCSSDCSHDCSSDCSSDCSGGDF